MSLLFALLVALSVNRGAADAAENIGRVQQPLVGGRLVTPEEQEQLGLLTYRSSQGMCSASLLTNDFVISALHCYSGKVWDQSLLGMWSTRQSRIAVQVETFGSLDIVLLRVKSPFLVRGSTAGYRRRMSSLALANLPGHQIEFFGRGISEFARLDENGNAIPSKTDFKYRAGTSTIGAIERSQSYSYSYSPKGSFGAGGDSGGPTYLVYGSERILVGVASEGQTFCLEGKTCNDWTWVSGAGKMFDAAVQPVLGKIQSIMAAYYATHQRVGEASQSTSPAVAALGSQSRQAPGQQTLAEARGRVNRQGAAITQMRQQTTRSTGIVPQCPQGFVWRMAGANDYICVTPTSRDRVAQENAAAASRRNPQGAYGPNSCVMGYVWREAFPGDVVCVTPQIRELVRQENHQAGK